MNIKKVSLVGIFLLLCFSNISSAYGSTNMVANPSFETNLDDWYDSPGSMTRYNGNAKDGDYSCRMTSENVGLFQEEADLLSEYITGITGGSEYNFTAWIYYDGGLGPTIDVELRWYSGMSHLDSSAVASITTSGWTEASWTGNAHSSADRVRININGFCPCMSSFEFYVDHIQLYDPTVPEFSILSFEIVMIIGIMGLIGFLYSVKKSISVSIQ